MTKHERYEHGVGPIYTTPLIDSLPLNPDHHDGILQAMPSRKDLDKIVGEHDRIVAGYEVLLHHWRVQQAEIERLKTALRNIIEEEEGRSGGVMGSSLQIATHTLRSGR